MCRSVLPPVIASSQEADIQALVRQWLPIDHVVMEADADELDATCLEKTDTLSAPEVELNFPQARVRVEGKGKMNEWFFQLCRGMPDLTSTLEDVTLGKNAVYVSVTVSGTQLQRCLPMFPVGMFATWRLSASVFFNKAGFVHKHCLSLCFDPCLGLSPPVHQGLAEWAHSLALTKSGSHLLQEAIQCDGSIGLLEQLRGSVVEAARSPHANHVLQKYIETMPPEAIAFIVEEFRGHAVVAASHCTSCRVLQRLVEHCPEQLIKPLVDELLAGLEDLVAHKFGNFVAQCLVEHGSAEVRRRVVEAICVGDAEQLARHWVASNVVRCAFVFASPEDRASLAQRIAPDSSALAKLSHHKNGSFVAREIKLAQR